MEKLTEIKIYAVGVIAAVYAFFVNIFGVFTPLLVITVGAMFADLITRVYAASVKDDEKPESKLVMKGIYKKIGLCMLIVLALMIDRALLLITQALGINIISKIMFTSLVMAWLLVRELISNAENLQHGGVELPSFLVKALSMAKDKVDSTANTIVDKKDDINDQI